MDRITVLIKDEIKRQYKNLRRFSEESGIPYSTLSNALSRGIGNTAYDTVVKICRLLNLKQLYDEDIVVFNDKFRDICAMLMAIDDRGVHTVETVLKMEYNRCKGEYNESGKTCAYNGLTYETQKIDLERQREKISKLVQEAKNGEKE